MMDKLLEIAEKMREVDLPPEIFFALIATMVDEYAERKDVDDETVAYFYKRIIEVRSQVQEYMAGQGEEK